METIIILFGVPFLFSCQREDKSKDAIKESIVQTKSNGLSGIEAYRPKIGYKPVSLKRKYLSSSNGSIDGSIIKGSKVPNEINVEYDNNSNLLNETISSNAYKW